MSDFINGLFELIGGLLIFSNCWRLWQDKCVKGWNVSVTVFFTAWGFYNLYFYPSLGLWYSFAGGCVIAIANMCWVSMAVYYQRKS